jgi:hypothetical protein
MSQPDRNQPWLRLAAAARQVRDDRDTAAPYGFATRVAALAFAPERVVSSLFERFSLRALGIASLLAIVSVAANYSTITKAFNANEDVATADDPVAELVDIAS